MSTNTCKRGHTSPRYESNGACIECAKASARRQYRKISDSPELREAHRQGIASYRMDLTQQLRASVEHEERKACSNVVHLRLPENAFGRMV